MRRAFLWHFLQEAGFCSFVQPLISCAALSARRTDLSVPCRLSLINAANRQSRDRQGAVLIGMPVAFFVGLQWSDRYDAGFVGSVLIAPTIIALVGWLVGEVGK